MPSYKGSCHCGAVTYEAAMEQTIAAVNQCNCSICSRKGALLLRLQPEQFRLLSGEGDLVRYQFGTKTASHYFCKHCGIHTHAHPRSNPALTVVNIRTLDDFDVDAEDFEVRLFDGRNWEEAVKALR